MQEEYIPQSEQPIEEIEPQVQSEVEPITDKSFFQVMKNELNRDVTKKDSEEMAILTEKFYKNKKPYGEASKQGQEGKKIQAELEADVVQTGDRIFKADSFRQELAEKLSNTEKIGHDPASKFPNHVNDLNAIINGNLEVVYDDNNTPGYELKDGFMPMQSIIDMVNGNAVDQKSKEGLKVLAKKHKEILNQDRTFFKKYDEKNSSFLSWFLTTKQKKLQEI